MKKSNKISDNYKELKIISTTFLIFGFVFCFFTLMLRNVVGSNIGYIFASIHIAIGLIGLSVCKFIRKKSFTVIDNDSVKIENVELKASNIEEIYMENFAEEKKSFYCLKLKDNKILTINKLDITSDAMKDLITTLKFMNPNITVIKDAKVRVKLIQNDSRVFKAQF